MFSTSRCHDWSFHHPRFVPTLPSLLTQALEKRKKKWRRDAAIQPPLCCQFRIPKFNKQQTRNGTACVPQPETDNKCRRTGGAMRCISTVVQEIIHRRATETSTCSTTPTTAAAAVTRARASLHHVSQTTNNAERRRQPVPRRSVRHHTVA